MAGYATLYAVLVALSLPVGRGAHNHGRICLGLRGGSATVIGASIGACAIFVIARSSLGEGLAKGRACARTVRHGFQKDAASYLLFLRFAPIFPFSVVNIASALLGARFSTFAWTTALGIIPGTFAFTSIGAGLAA